MARGRGSKGSDQKRERRGDARLRHVSRGPRVPSYATAASQCCGQEASERSSRFHLSLSAESGRRSPDRRRIIYRARRRSASSPAPAAVGYVMEFAV